LKEGGEGRETFTENKDKALSRAKVRDGTPQGEGQPTCKTGKSKRTPTGGKFTPQREIEKKEEEKGR